MNRSTLATTTKRLAAMTVILLALLLQACALCDSPADVCSFLRNEPGVYLVRYRDVVGRERTITTEPVSGGVIYVCDCAIILEDQFVGTASDISLVVSDSPDPVIVNQTLTYRITVTNNGPSPATDIFVEATLPLNVSLLDSSLTCAPANGNLVCKNPVGFALANGHSSTFTLRVLPTATGQVAMTVSAAAIQFDLDSNNNTLTQTTTVNPAAGSADASISIAAVPNPVRINNELRFSIVVQNLDSQTAASGVTMTGFNVQPVGELLSTDTTQGSCSISNGSLTCNIGTLAGGASATVTIRVMPFSAGTYTETVTVNSNNDRNSGNNNASVQVQVNPPG